MTDLEIKKAEAELAGVIAARLQLEYVIAQREEEVARIKENIKIQEQKELELKAKLNRG